MSRPFESVYSLLSEYSEQEVSAALSVVPERIGTCTPSELAAACRDWIEGKIVQAGPPRRNGFTQTEWQGIMATMREENKRICERRAQKARRPGPGYNLSDVRTFQALKKEIAVQQRTISDLLTYVGKI